MISYPKVNKLIAGCELNLANYPNKDIQGILYFKIQILISQFRKE